MKPQLPDWLRKTMAAWADCYVMLKIKVESVSKPRRFCYVVAALRAARKCWVGTSVLGHRLFVQLLGVVSITKAKAFVWLSTLVRRYQGNLACFTQNPWIPVQVSLRLRYLVIRTAYWSIRWVTVLLMKLGEALMQLMSESLDKSCSNRKA